MQQPAHCYAVSPDQQLMLDEHGQVQSQVADNTLDIVLQQQQQTLQPIQLQHQQPHATITLAQAESVQIEIPESAIAMTNE